MTVLAPVVCLDTARRRLIAQRLLRLGVPVATITATRNDQELADLWARERTIASLTKLTGHDRWLIGQWPTEDLIELERVALRQLMGASSRCPDRMIYSFGGRIPKTRGRQHRNELKAWGIDPHAA
jgi:hypothetical protein